MKMDIELKRLPEIRSDLSKVRLGSHPSWPIKALFAAMFQLIRNVEKQQGELDELRQLFSRLDGSECRCVSSGKGDEVVSYVDVRLSDPAQPGDPEQGKLGLDVIEPKSIWV